VGVWSPVSGLVVNDNSAAVAMETAAESSSLMNGVAEQVNSTRVVTTILVSNGYCLYTVPLNTISTQLSYLWFSDNISWTTDIF